MKILELNYAPGATPLDPGEILGLIPIHIQTQEQLNEWEQANIIEAEQWVLFQNWSVKPVKKLLTQQFVCEVHRRMFANTWRWAGKYRQTNKNIGVDWPIVTTALQTLLDDVSYQIAHNSFTIDETIARFHHRLVAVHCFANGNGRHARLFADILCRHLEQPLFSWGSRNLYRPGEARRHYLTALRAADQHDYAQLIEFVRK